MAKNNTNYGSNFTKNDIPDSEKDSPTTPLEDVSGSLSPTDRISSSNFREAADQENRADFSGSGFKTDMFTYDRILEAEKFGKEAEQKFGVPSMFNPYTIFTHPGADSINDFFDIKGARGIFPKHEKEQINSSGKIAGTGGRNLTIKALLTDFDPSGKTNTHSNPSKPYYASDFLYARYYKKAPLNRLITLRRYPFPTYDNLDFVGDGNNNRFKPIAQAITYFGEPTGNDLKDISKWSGFINWEELTADVHDVEGNEQGFDQSPLGGTGSIGKLLGAITNPSSQDLGGFKAEEIEAQKFNTFEYTNKVLGPVNVINQTFVRQRGIGSKKEFNIVFEYRLRSYNNINPRLAMLDLLFNMLALTFNNAKFWGGANRYFPRSPQFGFVGDDKAFYSGRYGDYMDSIIGQVSTGLGGAGAKIGELVSGILSGDLSGLASLAKGVGSTFMDLKRAKSRPKVIGFHALLSGLPIGEWHMTVGNPYRPFMMIGNLVCKGFDFEFSDHLGVDDFPTNLKFTVKLETGRPRDKGDLESMFQLGQGRSYYPPEGLIDITNTSSTTGANPINLGVNPSSNSSGGVASKAPNNPQVRGGANNRAEVDAEFAKKLIGTIYSLLLFISSLSII